jgi:hypothetical protein
MGIPNLGHRNSEPAASAIDLYHLTPDDLRPEIRLAVGRKLQLEAVSEEHLSGLPSSELPSSNSIKEPGTGIDSTSIPQNGIPANPVATPGMLRVPSPDKASDGDESVSSFDMSEAGDQDKRIQKISSKDEWKSANSRGSADSFQFRAEGSLLSKASRASKLTVPTGYRGSTSRKNSRRSMEEADQLHSLREARKSVLFDDPGEDETNEAEHLQAMVAVLRHYDEARQEEGRPKALPLLPDGTPRKFFSQEHKVRELKCHVELFQAAEKLVVSDRKILAVWSRAGSLASAAANP